MTGPNQRTAPPAIRPWTSAKCAWPTASPPSRPTALRPVPASLGPSSPSAAPPVGGAVRSRALRYDHSSNFSLCLWTSEAQSTGGA